MTGQKESRGRLPLVTTIFCTVLLTVSYGTNAMDRAVLPVLLTQISADYGFGLSTGGFLATIFALGAGLAAWPTGWLLDRWSRKGIVVLGMVVYSVFTGAIVFAHGFADMAFYRFLTGVGEAMQLAAIYTIVCSYFHRHRGLMVGVINVGFGLGNFIGPISAARLAAFEGGWHTPFLVFAVAGLILAVLIWLLIPRLFTEALVPDVTTTAISAIRQERFLNRNVVLCGISAACWGFAVFSHAGLYATFLITELDFQPTVAGLAISFVGIGGLFGFAGGWIGDRFSNSRVVILAWCILGVCWYLQYHFIESVFGQAFTSFVVGFAITSLLHPNSVVLMQRSAPDAFIGRATGFFHSCGYLTGGFAGLIFGGLIQLLGWSAATTIVLIGVPAIAIVALSMLKRSRLTVTEASGTSEPVSLSTKENRRRLGDQIS